MSTKKSFNIEVPSINIDPHFPEEGKTEPIDIEQQNQGTKEGRKQGSSKVWFEDERQYNYEVSLEERELTNAIPTNTELYEDQLVAINELIYLKSKKGKKTLTKKQFFIKAVDDLLKKEFNKLNETI